MHVAERDIIRRNVDMAQMAGILAEGGCVALSVLTEPYFFGGTGQDIVRVKSGVNLPVPGRISLSMNGSSKRPGHSVLMPCSSLLLFLVRDYRLLSTVPPTMALSPWSKSITLRKWNPL